MRDAYDDRFWAENHHILSNGIDRGVGRLRKALTRMFFRAVPPDQSDEARKRTYCIG